MESTARTAVQLLYCKLQISTPLGFIGIPLESVRLLGCTLQLGGLHLFKQLALGSRDLSQAEKKVSCGIFGFCFLLFPQNEGKIYKPRQLSLSQFVYFLRTEPSMFTFTKYFLL